MTERIIGRQEPGRLTRQDGWAWLMAGILLWAAVLLPFFLAARAAHPATDDFTFAAYTRATWVDTGSIAHVLKDALSYALRTWRDWQGTLTGVIIMTLNPAVFSIAHYGVHAVLLLVAHLAAWQVFLRHMLGHRLGLESGLCRWIAMMLSALSLVFLPDMVEGIYWFNGAWFYTGAQAAALLTLTACDVLAQARSKWVGAAAVGCGMLLFALGMDNYITAMMIAAVLTMMALQRLWAGERREALWTGCMLVPAVIGLLLSVIAPGNAVRMAHDGAYRSGMGWLMNSLIWTMRDAVFYIFRFSLKTPLAALLLVLTPSLSRAVGMAAPGKAKRCPPIPVSIVGFYLILCAMIVPHMYSSGYAGSGRVVNLYHFYVLLALPVLYVIILMRLAPHVRERLAGAGKCFVVLGTAALLLCLALGQQNHYLTLVRHQMDGTQQAYIAQFEREYALCEAAQEQDDVLLPAWTVQTLTGKPTAYEDPTVWTNVSMAHYFGVRSVRVQADGSM